MSFDRLDRYLFRQSVLGAKRTGLVIDRQLLTAIAEMNGLARDLGPDARAVPLRQVPVGGASPDVDVDPLAVVVPEPAE